MAEREDGFRRRRWRGVVPLWKVEGDEQELWTLAACSRSGGQEVVCWCRPFSPADGAGRADVG